MSLVCKYVNRFVGKCLGMEECRYVSNQVGEEVCKYFDR